MQRGKPPHRIGSSGGRGLRAAPPSAFLSGGTGTLPDGVSATVLDNGLTVLTEVVPAVRSASAGIWIQQGAVHETPAHLGVSHMLEHMVFKGTRGRTSRDIALALESLGGSLDAYTSREHTSYQARVLDRHLPVALDVLADLVRDPLLRPGDLDLEREVVLEEISTVEDTPDDLVFEQHARTLWGQHPLGTPILGTHETVSAMTADDLRTVHREAYHPSRMLVVAVGNLDHDDVVREVDARLGTLPEGEAVPEVSLPSPAPGGLHAAPRDSAQAHIVFGTPTASRSDTRRHALVLLAQAFGGGMSSRLFQRIREELGLAYAVFSFQSFYQVAGTLGVYVGTRPDTAAQAREAVRSEMARLARESLTPDELKASREQVKGQMTLGMESLSHRVHRLASFALHNEPVVGLEGLLARYDGVTAETVADCAAEFLDPDRHVVLTLGPEKSS